MYNVEIKHEYLNMESSVKKRPTMITALSSFTELEKKHGKDIYDIPYDVLSANLLKHTRITFNSYSNIMYAVRRYKIWALKMGYIDKDESPFIFSLNRKKMKEMYDNNAKINVIKNPSALVKELDVLAPVGDEDVITYDNIIRCYYELIYNGIPEEDVFDIKLDDLLISSQNIAIKTKDNIIIIYDEFYDDIKKLATTRIFCRNIQQVGKTIPIVADRLLSVEADVPDEVMREKIRKAIHNRIYINKNINIVMFKVGYIYVEGVLYRLLQTTNFSEITKKDLLKTCYGGTKFSTVQRDRVNTILEQWDN